MSRNKIIGIICGAVVAIAAITGIVVVIVNNNNNNSNSSSSSSSSGETKNDSASPIVGRWKYYVENSSYSIDYIYTFNNDGTGSYEMAGASKSFTYTTDGNKLTITYDSAPFETEYEINGDILNVKDSFGDDTLYKKI